MIFLRYPNLHPDGPVWVAVLRGSPEEGGVGVDVTGRVGNPDGTFRFSSKDELTIRRTQHRVNDLPENVLALWVEYALKKGIN